MPTFVSFSKIKYYYNYYFKILYLERYEAYSQGKFGTYIIPF